MAAFSVTFDFEIGDRVWLKEIDRPATVVAASIDRFGVMYQVVFWNDGHRSSEWVYAWEVAPEDRYRVSGLR